MVVGEHKGERDQWREYEWKGRRRESKVMATGTKNTEVIFKDQNIWTEPHQSAAHITSTHLKEQSPGRPGAV